MSKVCSSLKKTQIIRPWYSWRYLWQENYFLLLLFLFDTLLTDLQKVWNICSFCVFWMSAFFHNGKTMRTKIPFAKYWFCFKVKQVWKPQKFSFPSSPSAKLSFYHLWFSLQRSSFSLIDYRLTSKILRNTCDKTAASRFLKWLHTQVKTVQKKCAFAKKSCAVQRSNRQKRKTTKMNKNNFCNMTSFLSPPCRSEPLPCYCLFAEQNTSVCRSLSRKLTPSDKYVTPALSFSPPSRWQWQQHHYVSPTFSALSFSLTFPLSPLSLPPLRHWHFVFVTFLFSAPLLPYSHPHFFLPCVIDSCPIASVIQDSPTICLSPPSFPLPPHSLLLSSSSSSSFLILTAVMEHWCGKICLFFSDYFGFAAFDWIPQQDLPSNVMSHRANTLSHYFFFHFLLRLVPLPPPLFSILLLLLLLLPLLSRIYCHPHSVRRYVCACEMFLFSTISNACWQGLKGRLA